MKICCSKKFILRSLALPFFFLLVLFGTIKIARAETEFYTAQGSIGNNQVGREYTGYASIGYIAQGVNITKFLWYQPLANGSGTYSLKMCLDSNADFTCDTSLTEVATGNLASDCAEACWANGTYLSTLATPFKTTVGEHYMIEISWSFANTPHVLSWYMPTTGSYDPDIFYYLGFNGTQLYWPPNVTIWGDAAPAGVPNPNDANTSLFFFDNPYLCSNISTCQVKYVYNTDVWTQYDYIEIRRFASLEATTSDFVATTTIFDQLGVNYFGKGNGLSYFTLMGTSTDSGYSYYNVIGHLAAYYDVNLGNVAATTTIPYAVTVNWFVGNLITDYTDYLTATSSSGFIDTAALACSAEEWSASSSDLTHFKCSLLKSVLDIGIKPVSYLIDQFSALITKIRNTFPFTIFKTIQDSWKSETNSIVSFLSIKAAYATTSESFSTTTGIYTNTGDGFNFSLGNFLGLGTTSIKILSRQTIIDTLGQDVFNIYYYGCKFLIWALFLSFLWHLVTNRQEEML